MVRVVSANATGVSIVNSQMRSIVEAQHTHTRARAHTYTHTLCPRCRFRLTTKKFAYFEREGGEELGAAPIHTITTITLLSSDKEFLLTTVQPFTKSGQYEVCICAWLSLSVIAGTDVLHPVAVWLNRVCVTWGQHWIGGRCF